jgi:thiamine pyrophosphokinase
MRPLSLRERAECESKIMLKRTIIFINGDLPNLDAARKIIRDGDFIIAADGGTRHVLALGLIPSVVIGDLDSLDAANRRYLEKNRVEIFAYPKDKDETDLALALAYAVDAGYEQILLVGALGGRLDQTLGNLSLLTDPTFEGLDVRIDDGVEEAFFARRQAKIHGRIGEIISLLPWGGDVQILRTEGLRWSLQNEKLYAHKTRGISNEMIAENAEIQIESGFLLVIHARSS